MKQKENFIEPNRVDSFYKCVLIFDWLYVYNVQDDKFHLILELWKIRSALCDPSEKTKHRIIHQKLEIYELSNVTNDF